MKQIYFLIITALIAASSCVQNKSSFNTTANLLDGIDSTVRPQDDFFNYVNGGWIKKTAYPLQKLRGVQLKYWSRIPR